MSKTAVTRIFVGAILAVVAGLFVGLAAIASSLASGAIEFGGPQVITVHDAFAMNLLWLLVGSVLVTAGAIAAVVAWVGALFNTAQLDDKTWFIVLLVLGLFSFGWIATAAYVVAGPDGTKPIAAFPEGAAAPSS